MPRVVPSCRHTGLVTDDGELSWRERQRRGQVQARQEIRDQHVENARRLGDLSDAELIAQAPGFPGPGHEMEMSRRLKDSVELLTAELVTFRTSPEDAAARSDAAAGRLVRLTRWWR